jgi:bifunctional DNase/RNase
MNVLSYMISKLRKFFSKSKSLNFNFPPVKKIKLDILGISYTKSGEHTIYVVVLGEENGERKVPVIVNYYEAQAIAIEVEKISPIVPLIYDVFNDTIKKHKINFKEVLISDYKNDVLITHIIGKKEISEIRTADALALSIRLEYPIYIYDNVLTNVDSVVQKYYDIKRSSQVVPDKNRLEGFTLAELDGLLQKAIDEEEYEKASEIRDEIKKKKDHKVCDTFQKTIFNF